MDRLYRSSCLKPTIPKLDNRALPCLDSLPTVSTGALRSEHIHGAWSYHSFSRWREAFDHQEALAHEGLRHGRYSVILDTGDWYVLSANFGGSKVEWGLIFLSGGSIMASGTLSAMQTGAHIIVGGLFIQVLFFGFFITVAVVFDSRIQKRPTRQYSNLSISF